MLQLIDQRSFAVDPTTLYNKLEMVKLDSMLDHPTSHDDFDYFSRVAQKGSCIPTEHPSPFVQSPQVRRHRAMSVKQRTHKREQPITEGEQRPRTNSVPSREQLQRVRNFQTCSRGIKNQGDTVRSRGTGSEVSLSSSHSSDEINGHRPLCSTTSGGSESAASDFEGPSVYRILLLGGTGVGKTALTHQFLTSDDVHDLDYVDDGAEKSVSVSLDGEESFLIFMDSDYNQNRYDPSSADAYIAVYSTAERQSFEEAEKLLQNLRHFEKFKAIILCGNKSDLARKRQVTTEDGKTLAGNYDCKFIETSTMLNHKVDHLLAGILSQIREKERKSSKQSKRSNQIRKSLQGLVDKFVNRGSGKKRDNAEL